MSDNITTLLKKREETHGDAAETFDLQAKLTKVYLAARSKTDSNNKKSIICQRHDATILHILSKIARIACGKYNKDDWTDIQGYAELGNQMQLLNNYGKPFKGIVNTSPFYPSDTKQ
tara:strand:- start:176 stop:526 length:351 start_codon:yes stop_codon:yes gene_type:complete